MRSRVEIALFHPPGTRADEIERFAEARERVSDDRLRVTAIKLYIDDVIEAHTAAMLAPYADQPDENGDTFYTPEEFDEIVTRLDAAGFQMFIHAIGDRGIRVALDSLARARQINGARDSRHQLVHIELVSPKDIPRFGELGVVACMQPRHVAPENIAQWAAAVGPARAPNAFPWRSLQEAGATLAFSSDWDVSEMDPLVGIYSALTRRSLDGEPREGWQPQESLDLESAIRAYTMGGAFANFMEEDRGSIRVGKYADLILLSRDLFEIPEEEILDTHVVLTMVGGEIVYQAD
jgi:predicted amidohydrolase YtcJ